MAGFTVSEVFDGDTFKVEEGWKWNQRSGDIIRAAGYNTPEKGNPGYEKAKEKLKKLILNDKVEIKNYQTIDDWGRLVADVYCEGKNLADYFPEYKL